MDCGLINQFTILTFCPGGSECSACLVPGSPCCSRCLWTSGCRGCPWGCWSPAAARTAHPQPRSWTWAAVSSGYFEYTRNVGDVWSCTELEKASSQCHARKRHIPFSEYCIALYYPYRTLSVIANMLLRLLHGHLGGLAGRWWRLDIRASIDLPDLLFWWENERVMLVSVFLSLDPALNSSSKSHFNWFMKCLKHRTPCK